MTTLPYQATLIQFILISEDRQQYTVTTLAERPLQTERDVYIHLLSTPPARAIFFQAAGIMYFQQAQEVNIYHPLLPHPLPFPRTINDDQFVRHLIQRVMNLLFGTRPPR